MNIFNNISNNNSNSHYYNYYRKSNVTDEILIIYLSSSRWHTNSKIYEAVYVLCPCPPSLFPGTKLCI